MRLNRSGQTITRTINKLYSLGIIEENESMGHEMKEMSRRPRRGAAIMGEVNVAFLLKSFLNILSGEYLHT